MKEKIIDFSNGIFAYDQTKLKIDLKKKLKKCMNI